MTPAQTLGAHTYRRRKSTPRPVPIAESVGTTAYQPALDELGTPLADVTFVVLDLETTGTSARGAGITEIGAVKVRGGEVIGEFQTLVNPGEEIPAYITRLTGISNRMVEAAPPINAVLPSLWEFLHGAVLVAHNASFDVSFLRAAARAMDLAWPGPHVVDTLALARRVVTRDEVPNHKLGTLAALFGAQVTPDHRALSDARATVDVLHALLARLAPWGITHLEDLRTASDPVEPEVRAKRHLADGLPSGPGVYVFHAADGEVLYVGTSVNVRKRVRSYFTAAEKRSKMRQMLRLCVRVTAIGCATVLEANVRELRMIAEHSPRFNRRSKFPERMPWLRLTAEPHPRLAIVTEVRDASGSVHIGPFNSRKAAQAALEAVHASTSIRQCTTRLPKIAAASARACLLAEIGRCAAPCVAADDAAGAAARNHYLEAVAETRAALTSDPGVVVNVLTERMDEYVRNEAFEAATLERDRLAAFLQGAQRAERFGALSRCAELTAVRRTEEAGWEVSVIRHGRLAASAIAPAGTDPVATITAAIATAEDVVPPVSPATATHPHETLLLLDWLDDPGVRLVAVTHPLFSAVRGPCSHAELLRDVQRARSSSDRTESGDTERHRLRQR